MNKTTNGHTDDTQRLTDALALQEQLLDRLVGMWLRTLRIILTAVAVSMVLLGGMVVYMTWSTHHRAQSQFDRLDRLHGRITELQKEVSTQWHADREAIHREAQAFQDEIQARLERELEAFRATQADSLRSQTASIHSVRRDLDRALDLIQELTTSTEQYSRSIAEEEGLRQRMQAALIRLQDQEGFQQQATQSLSQLVTQSQDELSLREQLLFYLIAEALAYPEVAPQLKFDIAYRWYLLRKYDVAMGYFEAAQVHRDELGGFASSNIDRLLRTCRVESDKDGEHSP